MVLSVVDNTKNVYILEQEIFLLFSMPTKITFNIGTHDFRSQKSSQNPFTIQSINDNKYWLV